MEDSATQRLNHEATPGIAPLGSIRSRFPALERVQDGLEVAYFDAPGGTQVPREVAEAVSEQMLRHNANAHWNYASSRELDREIDESRRAMADFVGGQPDEIVFGANMTTLTFHAARALGRTFAAGDEIVVTELDHEANVSPWRDLEFERGIVVRTVPLEPESGDLDWDSLEACISRKTRLIAVTAASNALGTIIDTKRVASIARASGALLFVDAVHFAPHERVDVARMECDLLACSAYKFYGPHVGIMWARGEILENILPSKLQPAPDRPPEKWETGTGNHEGMVGARAAVDFLASLADGEDRGTRLDRALAALSRRGGLLVSRLWEGLADIPGVTLFGPPPHAPRTPTVSFSIAGTDSASAAARLSDEAALFLSHGDFYASSVTRRLGLESAGLIRAGCACYTSEEEVDRLVAAVSQVAEAPYEG